MTYKTEIENIKLALLNLYENGGRRAEWIRESNPNHWRDEYKDLSIKALKKRIVTLSEYRQMFERLNYQVGNPYHANGIGNNNEYRITKRIALDGGYETEVIIGSFNYNYDLYGKHVFVSFFDKDKNLVYRDRENIYHE